MLFLDGEVLSQIGGMLPLYDGVFVQCAGGRQMNLVLLCPSGCGIISVTGTECAIFDCSG